MAEKKIEFLATIPPIQSALKFGGDTGRITLEVPKSEIEKAVGLIALQDVVLKVTIEVYDGNSKETGAKAEEERKPSRELPQNFRF